MQTELPTPFAPQSFKAKRILITGGGSGLGKSMCALFVQLGAQVIICSRDAEKLRQTAEHFNRDRADAVLYAACDVRDYQQVEELITHFSATAPIDALINNAAGNFISPSENLSANAFDTIIDIVLKGSKNFTLALGKEWIKQQHPGVMLNIVTTYAHTGSGYVVPSAMAKAGVVAMTKSLAVEWGKYAIRMNAVAPGPFPTKGAWDRLLPGDLKKKFDPSRRVPLQRVGEHHELANLCAFLLSPFSGYINGEVITIDGGEWLQGGGQFNGLSAVTPEMWAQLEAMIRSKKEKGL